MGSKAPLEGKPVQDEVRDERFPASPAEPMRSVASRLLQQISDALQVPPATLHRPPNILGGDLDLDAECRVLLEAYRRIADPERRRRLLVLVQASTDPG